MAIFWDVMLVCEPDVADALKELLESEFSYKDYQGKVHTHRYKNIWYPSIRTSKYRTATEFFWSSVCWQGSEIEAALDKILDTFAKKDEEGSGYFFVKYNDYNVITMRRHAWYNEHSDSVMCHTWLGFESDDFVLTEQEVI